MFTGIVTDIGTVRAVEERGDARLTIGTRYDSAAIPLGASIAVSGVCLTVVDRGRDDGGDWFAVDVSAETRRCTADRWRAGARLNLERSLKVGDELGGHIVTGHVDGVGTVLEVIPEGQSQRLTIAAPPTLAPHIAAKGSIALDGVSLTVNGVEDGAEGVRFTLNLIPHSAEATTLGALQPGEAVNLEIDILARYLARLQAARGA